MYSWKLTLCYLVLCMVLGIRMDKPCAARSINGQSVVCVCNETYCDDIARSPPLADEYFTYTSSQEGARFEKQSGTFEHIEQSSESCETVVELDPDTKYQHMEGFGGAVTDSAGINWKSLPDTLQKYLVESYFGDNGLQYSMLRVPIGGSDFSTRGYAYNELPVNDTLLTNFTLAPEDLQYKLPMIKACMDFSSTPVHVVATTWSPPSWMKTNNALIGRSRLRPEYYQTYADYHLKFIESYAKEGVDVWAITTTNEPINGVVPLGIYINSLGWSVNDMGQWIGNNLGPTIRNSKHKDVKILAVDDQRYMIPIWFTAVIRDNPEALNYIDGIAVHYYGDFVTPASVLSHVSKKYPKLFILATEGCEGSFPWEQPKVVLGSWKRARNYILDIIEDLNHNVVGWMDWNLCLDDHGGPTYVNNFVDSPIIVRSELKEFVKQPMFYAIGHFAKFVPRGSKRIATTETKPMFYCSINNVAFITTRNTIVVILYNDSSKQRQICVKVKNKVATIDMPPHSITTVEFAYEEAKQL